MGVLLNALKDNRLSLLHDTLAEAIATLGPRAAPVVPELIVQSRDRHPEVRRNSAIALGHVGAVVPAVIPALANALSDSDHEVRIAAIDALIDVGAPARSISPALARAVTDPISYIRIGAITALDKVGAPNELVIPALVQALATTDRDTRAAVADALGQRLGPRFSVRGSLAATAESTLERLLRDEDPVVRSRTATALGIGGIVGHAAIPALVHAGTDPNAEVSAAAHAALARINR